MPENELNSKIQNLKISSEKKGRPSLKKSRKKWYILGSIGLLILIIILVNSMRPPTVETAQVTMIVPPKPGEVILSASGYVVPNHRIELSPKIIGRVVWMGVDKGDLVKKGQIIVRLEAVDYEAQVRQAEAQVQSAKAQLTELRNGSRPEEIEIAREAITLAESNQSYAYANYKRQINLFHEGAVSRDALENASTQWVVSQTQVVSAKQKFQLAKKGPRVEQIQAAEAQLKSSQAALALTHNQLKDTVITSPVDGTILERLAEVGELVTNTNFGGTRGARNALVSIANLNDLQVEIDLNEGDIPKIHLGQTATIQLESYPDSPYEGKVVEIAPEANRQKATLQLKVQVLKPDTRIKPEMNAKVSFINDQKEMPDNEIVRYYIPFKALVKRDGKEYVFTIDKSKKVKMTPVIKGKESELGLEILEGLSGQETVIVNPSSKISDGIRVALPKE